MTLCSYANFRSAYCQIEGIFYLVGPSKWVCRTSELAEWFRTRFQHQLLSILNYLQKQNCITYTRLDRNGLDKFTINGWKQHNTVPDYNYPCLNDVGFFFFPVAAVHELISMEKCLEMNIVLNLWVHAIYEDGQVQGLELELVVYFRNATGNPLTSGLALGHLESHYQPHSEQTAGQMVFLAGILHWQARQRHLPEQLLIHHVQR